MAELRVVPSTQWVGVRGFHPGALIEVRRVTPTAVYFRTIREGAGTGPRHRRGGPKNRLDHAEFLLNYRPNTKHDWMLAAQGADEPEGTHEGNNGTVTTEDLAASGRLHANEEAIAQAIRDGAKYHDVQRDYKVAGRILHEIIAKYGVPYQTTRQKEQARAADQQPEPAPEPVIPVVEDERVLGPLHAQEDEIVQMMLVRAGSFQDVMIAYHVKPQVLAAIMDKHNIPRRSKDERRDEKRAYGRAYYHRKRQERLEREAALEELRQAEQAASAAAEASASSVEREREIPAPPAVVESLYAPTSEPPRRQTQTWRVTLTVRTEIVQTFSAESYLDAAQAALASHPSGEIVSLVRTERNAS